MATRVSYHPQAQSNRNADVSSSQYRRAAEAISAVNGGNSNSGGSTNTRRLVHGNTNRRVVAQPMDSISPIEATTTTTTASHYLDTSISQHHPQPALYDTSVSSATLTNSAEDGRSTGSSGVNQYRLNVSSSSSSRPQQGFQLPQKVTPYSEVGATRNYTATATRHYQRSNNTNSNRYSHDGPKNTIVTQSEPGVSVEHDRFSAYINRFAELDPRMDHRYSIDARYSIDEKKIEEEDQVPLSMEETEQQLRQQKQRFRTRAGYLQQQQQQQQQEEQQVQRVTPSRSQEELQSSMRQGRRDEQVAETASDIGMNHNSSPSNRTRDLARRIEQHMGRKQLLQQRESKIMEEEEGGYESSLVANPSADAHIRSRVSLEDQTLKDRRRNNQVSSSVKGMEQSKVYHPPQALSATYLPIPNPSQYVDEDNMISNHRPTSATSLPKNHLRMEEGVPNPMSTNRIISEERSPRSNELSRKVGDFSKAPTYPDWKKGQDGTETPRHLQPNDDSNIPQRQLLRRQQQQQLQQQQQQQQQLLKQQHLILDMHREETETSRPSRRNTPTELQQHNYEQQNQYVDQRASRHLQQQQQQPRSRSLGPPQRRRQRHLQESVPVNEHASSNDNVLHNTNDMVRNDEAHAVSHEPLIRRVGNRAEIETPLPAKVRELQRMLWTEDELLQVKVRSSYRDTESNGNHYYGSMSMVRKWLVEPGSGTHDRYRPKHIVGMRSIHIVLMAVVLANERECSSNQDTMKLRFAEKSTHRQNEDHKSTTLTTIVLSSKGTKREIQGHRLNISNPLHQQIFDQIVRKILIQQWQFNRRKQKVNSLVTADITLIQKNLELSML
jgi:hypothetical protein